MRTDKTFSSAPAAIIAMLCAASLFTFACGRQAEEPRESELSTASAVEETRAADTYPAPETPSGVEIREDRAVDVPDEEVASAGQSGTDELDAHQRELDQKEADLEARARRLRDLERRQREIDAAEREIERRETQVAEKPVKRPQPARPEPEPEEDVDTEEVAQVPQGGGDTRGSDPEPARADDDEIARSREEAREEANRPEPATVPAGTVVAAEFLETLSSESSRPGDTFRARLTGDVRQGGRVVIPAGSEVVGEVTDAVPLRKVGGQARLGVRFTDLILPHGVSVPIDASFVGQGKSETGRDAATIGGAAAGGAVLGRVINKRDRSRGAVIGAILGAAIGTAIASRTQGEEVNIFEGSVLDLKFDEPVEIPARR